MRGQIKYYVTVITYSPILKKHFFKFDNLENKKDLHNKLNLIFHKKHQKISYDIEQIVTGIELGSNGNGDFVSI